MGPIRPIRKTNIRRCAARMSLHFASVVIFAPIFLHSLNTYPCERGWGGVEIDFSRLTADYAPPSFKAIEYN